MIEVIFLIGVIAVLAKIVLPNISNSFQVVYSNYVIKNIYADLRYVQAANKISVFNRDYKEIFYTYNKPCGIFYARSSNKYFGTVLRNNNNLLRENKLVKNFSFNKIGLMTFSSEGIPNFFGSKSGHLNLIKNSSNCSPYIVYDSVGRLRLSRTAPE
ncbi:MAG: hypothetical protein IJ728_02030 [Selenomonadaceae bacterium]|nr:hypothetical protein [Selenomonadaceae bacterium]